MGPGLKSSGKHRLDDAPITGCTSFNGAGAQKLRKTSVGKCTVRYGCCSFNGAGAQKLRKTMQRWRSAGKRWSFNGAGAQKLRKTRKRGPVMIPGEGFNGAGAQKLRKTAFDDVAHQNKHLSFNGAGAQKLRKTISGRS